MINQKLPKLQSKMYKKQIKEFLKKKNKNKIDSYFKAEEKIKENETDLMNLLQTWLHCLLYYKRIYTQDAFNQREILGISVYNASSPPLKQYLDNFFKKVKQHIAHINHLQVIFYASNNSIIQINTIHIHSQIARFSQELSQTQQNILLKQILIKGFLSNLQQKMTSGFIRKQQQDINFKLRIGYRYQTYDKINNELLNNWLIKDRIQGNATIACSLIISELNLLYEIIS